MHLTIVFKSMKSFVHVYSNQSFKSFKDFPRNLYSRWIGMVIKPESNTRLVRVSAASKPPHVTGRAPDTSKRAWLNPSYSGTLNAFDVSDEQLDPEKKGKLAWSPAAHEDWIIFFFRTHLCTRCGLKPVFVK